MKRRILPILLTLALCLGLLPATALAAAENAPTTLYVGNYQITSGNATTYLKAGSTQGSLVEGSENDWTVKYDPSAATLTLNGATITGSDNISSVPYGSGIYALCSSNQPVALTIELIGTNTITGHYGIYVNAQQGETVGTNASLLIRNSSDNGMLEVSGSNHGIFVNSGTGNASLNIEKATVTSSTDGEYAAGVNVQSSANATGSPNISLSVNGGSLTTSGSASGEGIKFYVGAYEANSATTSLSVTNNAIVDARNGGISASGVRVNPNVNIGSNDNTSGIVWNGPEGTVYGDVTLQEDLEIGEGETLTIPEGASLNTSGELTVNGGTLTQNGTVTGDVTYKVTGVSLDKDSLTLDVGGIATLTATVEPEKATNKHVTWKSNNTNVATVSGGVVAAVGAGTTTITVETEDGKITDTCTVTVNAAAAVPVEIVSLNKTELTLTEGNSETLTATVEPTDATNQNVTWSSSAESVATVNNGVVTAILLILFLQ